MIKKNKENTPLSHRIFSIAGIVLCVILIPILIINVTLIAKSYTNKDEVPKIGGYCPLIVLTGSMEPKISSGDLIIVKQIDGSEVKENDIIAFFDPDGNGQSILTHRVVSITEENGQTAFITKGDANNTQDRLPVTSDKLVGIYSFRIRGMGSVAMFMQTTSGLIICVVLPLILLVGYDIIRRRRFDKRNQQDTAALLAELGALKAEKAAKEDSETKEESEKE